MATPVEFDPRAIDEARAARRFYARGSAALANRFMAALDDAVVRVYQFPQACPPTYMAPASVASVVSPSRSCTSNSRPARW
jgi:ParE toxin of type II toxin-antitoxin system, parDE